MSKNGSKAYIDYQLYLIIMVSKNRLKSSFEFISIVIHILKRLVSLAWLLKQFRGTLEMIAIEEINGIDDLGSLR